MANNIIDLSVFLKPTSKTLSGRPQGAAAREKLEIEIKDNDDINYEVILPSRLRTFASSFFLGLFSKSVKKYGKEGFHKKYVFVFQNDNLEEILKKDIAEGMYWALKESGIL